MKRQHTRFPPPQLIPPGKPGIEGIHYPTSYFGPLSKGSVTKPMLITAFDAYLTPRLPGAVSLAHKCVNLKEPYNQDMKEKVTIKKFPKKKTGFT